MDSWKIQVERPEKPLSVRNSVILQGKILHDLKMSSKRDERLLGLYFLKVRGDLVFYII